MKRRVVTFSYVLRDPSGRVLDTSAGGEPVTFLEAAGQIIDGLDEQLRDAVAGERRRIEVEAEKAYGLHDAAQVQQVAREQIPVEGDLAVGDQFRTDADVHAPIVTIVAVDEEQVTLDANHPLAGVNLTFEVEVLDVREATENELAHGHAHGPDGSQDCS